MKIQEVTIEGYQSHTNSTFRLSPGLTVITGPSDAGKTAIIRALRWFAFNEPTGEAFLHTIRNPDGSVKEQVKVRIEDIVSEALNVVFGGNHKFMIDLTLRGNQPIAEYYLNDDSVITKLEKPDYDRGGGKIDIIALALRLAVGEMEGVDGPLFLDEVGKHVSKEYAPSVAYFLKEYSATFGRQIILITHNADLAEIGEVSLAVKRSQNGESEVSVL